MDAAEAVDETTAAMVWAMVRAGLRVGEAIALHRSDVDLTTGMLNVRRSMNRSGELVPVKGRRRQDQGRRIPIPADLTERLGRHLASSRLAAIDGFLFTAPRGGPISYARWRQRTWSRIVDTAGVDARPHDLRRTCATRLIVEDRWSPAEVQAFLGHRDPRVTLAIYTMISADEAANTVLDSDLAENGKRFSCGPDVDQEHHRRPPPPPRNRKPLAVQGVSLVGATGIKPVTSAV